MNNKLEKTIGRLAEKIGALPTSEYAGSFILLLGTLAAIWLANGQFGDIYSTQLSRHLTVNLGAGEITESVRQWSNQILMAIFFLFVGLEIKEELVLGSLSSPRKAFLPAAGALGGFAVPAAIFIALNYNQPGIMGWAVPTATDPAFALAVLAAMKNRIPAGARALFLTLAVIDDLVATLVIALVYSDGAAGNLLLESAVIIIGLIVLNRLGIMNLVPYLVIGLLLWVGFVRAGIHTSVAAVILAFLIPISVRTEGMESPLLRLKTKLSPWVNFLVLPLFALLNAGLVFTEIPFKADGPRLAAAGVFLGLVLGKPLGIVGGSYLAQKLQIARLPGMVTWKHVLGIGFLGGIGFTTALFLANLAYGEGGLYNYIQLSVLLGSLLSALAGTIVFLVLFPRPN